MDGPVTHERDSILRLLRYFFSYSLRRRDLAMQTFIIAFKYIISNHVSNLFFELII